MGRPNPCLVYRSFGAIQLQRSVGLGLTTESEWYFFSHKDRKYLTGMMTNRAMTVEFWKAIGRDKVVYSLPTVIGLGYERRWCLTLLVRRSTSASPIRSCMSTIGMYIQCQSKCCRLVTPEARPFPGINLSLR